MEVKGLAGKASGNRYWQRFHGAEGYQGRVGVEHKGHPKVMEWL